MAPRIIGIALATLIALTACAGDDDPALLTQREPTAQALADTKCWITHNHDPDCLTAEGSLRDHTLDEADQIMLTEVAEPLTADGERAVRDAITELCMTGPSDQITATFDQYQVTADGREQLDEILVDPFCPRN